MGTWKEFAAEHGLPGGEVETNDDHAFSGTYSDRLHLYNLTQDARKPATMERALRAERQRRKDTGETGKRIIPRG